MRIFLHISASHVNALNVCILILMDDPYATLVPNVESLKEYYQSMSFNKRGTVHAKTIASSFFPSSSLPGGCKGGTLTIKIDFEFSLLGSSGASSLP